MRCAPLLALLLRRAVRVEVVELAARERLGARPLAVRFLNGSLDALSFGEIIPLNRQVPLAPQNWSRRPDGRRGRPLDDWPLPHYTVALSLEHLIKLAVRRAVVAARDRPVF